MIFLYSDIFFDFLTIQISYNHLILKTSNIYIICSLFYNVIYIFIDMSQWILAKLNAKSNDKIIIINSDQNFRQNLWHYNIILYDNYKIVENPNLIILFCSNMNEFYEKMSEYNDNINNQKMYTTESILWICYPKLSWPWSSDINRDKMRKYMIEKYSMTWVKMISVDDTYSAMRFKMI